MEFESIEPTFITAMDLNDYQNGNFDKVYWRSSKPMSEFFAGGVEGSDIYEGTRDELPLHYQHDKRIAKLMFQSILDEQVNSSITRAKSLLKHWSSKTSQSNVNDDAKTKSFVDSFVPKMKGINQEPGLSPSKMPIDIRERRPDDSLRSHADIRQQLAESRRELIHQQKKMIYENRKMIQENRALAALRLSNVQKDQTTKFDVKDFENKDSFKKSLKIVETKSIINGKEMARKVSCKPDVELNASIPVMKVLANEMIADSKFQLKQLQLKSRVLTAFRNLKSKNNQTFEMHQLKTNWRRLKSAFICWKCISNINRQQKQENEQALELKKLDVDIQKALSFYETKLLRKALDSFKNEHLVYKEMQFYRMNTQSTVINVVMERLNEKLDELPKSKRQTSDSMCVESTAFTSKTAVYMKKHVNQPKKLGDPKGNNIEEVKKVFAIKKDDRFLAEMKKRNEERLERKEKILLEKKRKEKLILEEKQRLETENGMKQERLKQELLIQQRKEMAAKEEFERHQEELRQKRLLLAKQSSEMRDILCKKKYFRFLEKKLATRRRNHAKKSNMAFKIDKHRQQRIVLVEWHLRLVSLMREKESKIDTQIGIRLKLKYYDLMQKIYLKSKENERRSKVFSNGCIYRAIFAEMKSKQQKFVERRFAKEIQQELNAELVFDRFLRKKCLAYWRLMLTRSRLDNKKKEIEERMRKRIQAMLQMSSFEGRLKVIRL